MPPLESEIELPLPLDGQEIKNGIAFKVADAVMSSLDKHCRLYGRAYPKFKASILIHFELEDFGEVFDGNAKAIIGAEETIPVAITDDIAIEIPHTPPNQFRRETEQPVPTSVRMGTRQEQKNISYAGRGRRR